MGFKENHPELWAGLLEHAQEAPLHNFPWRIRAMVMRGEEPTPNQVGACYRSLKVKATVKKKRPKQHGAATKSVFPIEEAMGKDTPDLRHGDYRFVWVDGTILIRYQGEYVGKIRGGHFFRAQACGDVNAADIAVIANLLETKNDNP